MTDEKRTIEVRAFRDKDGAPTCCAEWPQRTCVFMSTRKMGLVEICLLTGRDIDRAPAGGWTADNMMSPQEHLWLRPHKGCIVWGVTDD